MPQSLPRTAHRPARPIEFDHLILRTAKLVLLLLATVAAVAVSSPARAQIIGSAPASPEQLLTLAEALRLAADEQPSVAAFQSEAQAAEQAAVAARTLPDPSLTAGLQNYPVTGRTAFDPTRDDMTMFTVGFMREQVRRSRREADAARLRAEALVSRTGATAQELRVRRDVMIAWINAVEARAKQRLLARLVSDLIVNRQVITAGIPTGSSTPATALEAQAEVALAQAQLAEARGQEARARAEMRRWVGSAAARPVPDAIPAFAAPDEVAMTPSLGDHPYVGVAEAQGEAARRQIDVARNERKPNLTWSVMYGLRPRYDDMISAQVSIPLQINRRNFQDRRIAEASARADAARLRAEDARRELEGAWGTAQADYRSADAQLAVIDTQAVPSLEASFKAAEARYASGQGSLEVSLTLVRRYVEVTVQSLEQQGRRARAAAELAYLSQDVLP